MKTIHYPNVMRFHLVTIAPMAPFTAKSTSKLRSALYCRNSIVIPRFIFRAICSSILIAIITTVFVNTLMSICDVIVTMKIKDPYDI